MKEAQLCVSVRNLVEYSLKSGSIDYEYTSRSRAVDGVIYHQKIQKMRHNDAELNDYYYAGEVSFSQLFTVQDMDITVRGRADGILIKNDTVYIEEIKTTLKDLGLIVENPLHIAQAKCYGYFYMLKNGGNSICVLLSYCNIESFLIKEFEYTFTFDELKSFFDDILNVYALWAKRLIEWEKKRNISVSELTFPYESYRAGQRNMLESVYRTVERGKNIFINAPTGIGKTISSLFPAIKALERKKADKIFYLTAKTVTRKAALDAVTTMSQKGFFNKTIVLTAKDKICFMRAQNQYDENIESEAVRPMSKSCRICKYAQGHFDRINDALLDIMEKENIITKLTIEYYAKKHTVCPYEFSLDIALFSDIIICDYNYAFDKRIYLRRFFADTDKKYVFLVDEAHNLVDRARDMYSSTIVMSEIKALYKRIGDEGAQLKAVVKEIMGFLLDISKDITDNDYGIVLYNLPQKIKILTSDYCSKADKWLAENRESAVTDSYEAALEMYFSFSHFLTIWQIFNDKFVCYCEKEHKDIIFKLFCVHPGECLGNMLDNAKAAVFFSATLTPLSYFAPLLGGKADDYKIMIDSPFPIENAKVLVCGAVSTKYKKRQKFYGVIADYIYTAIMSKVGNYFIFFPSYAFLDNVWDEFADKYPQINTVVQTPNLQENEKESFLNWFNNKDEPVAAFAVLGGMFSEGIDLPGDKLIGALIVSVGLPKMTFERSIISDYFNNEKSAGFEYAYIYPGMNKVLQAGGRVIRTVSDMGVIVLIDERFCENDYKRLFPPMWANFKRVNSVLTLKKELGSFWESSG